MSEGKKTALIQTGPEIILRGECIFLFGCLSTRQEADKAIAIIDVMKRFIPDVQSDDSALPQQEKTP